MVTPRARLIRDDEVSSLLDLYAHLHPDDSSTTPDVVDSVWKQVRSTPGIHIIVADNDGLLVASCALCIIPNLTRGCRPYGLIENVVTHADFRRQGFGKQVVCHALDMAWVNDCYKVMLLTGRSDPEIRRFYESCGFVSGQKSGFLAVPSS